MNSSCGSTAVLAGAAEWRPLFGFGRSTFYQFYREYYQGKFSSMSLEEAYLLCSAVFRPNYVVPVTEIEFMSQLLKYAMSGEQMPDELLTSNQQVLLLVLSQDITFIIDLGKRGKTKRVNEGLFGDPLPAKHRCTYRNHDVVFCAWFRRQNKRDPTFREINEARIRFIRIKLGLYERPSLEKIAKSQEDFIAVAKSIVSGARNPFEYYLKTLVCSSSSKDEQEKRI